MSWYLFRVKPYRESKAFNFFKSFGVESYFPEEINLNGQNIEVFKPLLRGYIFVKWDTTPINYTLLNQNPYTTDILKSGNIPIEIPDIQLDTMRDHVSFLNKKNDLNFYKSGDSIEIKFGFFKGYKGKVIEIKKNVIHVYLDSSNSKFLISQ